MKPKCAQCLKPFSNVGNLKKHARLKRCTAIPKRSDPIRCPLPAGLGLHRRPASLKEEGSNFRMCPVGRCRPPFPGSILAAMGMVDALGQEEGRDAIVDGDYQKTSITLAEADTLLSLMWGGETPTSTTAVLAGCRVTRFPGTVIHLCHTLPGAASTQTVHEHSDAKATVVLQVGGTKDVEVGGAHKVTELLGESHFLTKAEAEAFHERSSTRTLQPGNIVCFDKRHIHQLTTRSTPNASISISIQ